MSACVCVCKLVGDHSNNTHKYIHSLNLRLLYSFLRFSNTFAIEKENEMEIVPQKKLIHWVNIWNLLWTIAKTKYNTVLSLRSLFCVVLFATTERTNERTNKQKSSLKHGSICVCNDRCERSVERVVQKQTDICTYVCRVTTENTGSFIEVRTERTSKQSAAKANKWTSECERKI